MPGTKLTQPENRVRVEGTISADQPEFTKNLIGRLKNPDSARMSAAPSELNRVGDIRAEDLFPGSIRSLHIGSLSADDITSGTLDADLVTIASADGSMEFADNIIAIDDAGGTRQVTLGKYDGTNYGLAIGADPNNPDVVIDEDGILVTVDESVRFEAGVGVYFLGDSLGIDASIAWRSSDDILVIRSDGASFSFEGTVSVGANVKLCGLSALPADTQNGTGVIGIRNRTAAPSTNPSNGGILYAEGGALVWRGSGGTVTTIAPA